MGLVLQLVFAAALDLQLRALTGIECWCPKPFRNNRRKRPYTIFTAAERDRIEASLHIRCTPGPRNSRPHTKLLRWAERGSCTNPNHGLVFGRQPRQPRQPRQAHSSHVPPILIVAANRSLRPPKISRSPDPMAGAGGLALGGDPAVANRDLWYLGLSQVQRFHLPLSFVRSSNYFP